VAHFFKPLKRDPRRRGIVAFDTEGVGGGSGFVCGAAVDDTGTYSFTDPDDLLRFLTCPSHRSHWIFAHNLEYDLGVMLGGDLRSFSCLFAKSRLLWAETQDAKGRKYRFCDSSNLFSGRSVADLGRMVDCLKIDLHPRLAEHLKEGLPLHTLPPDDQWQITTYNCRDAEILYLALEALQEELLSMGGQLQPTIAGCSMDLFRRRYLIDPWPVPGDEINRLARLAFYGARVEPHVLGRIGGINGYDISSLYPSVQARAQFPYPGTLVLDVEGANQDTILRREGIAQATISVPGEACPSLPVRLSGRLFFPEGRLVGAWTHVEIRHALEAGARLERIEWDLWSTTTFNPFADFIQALYRQKKLYASSGDMRLETFKQLLTSAYGRYGIQWEEGLEILEPLIPPVDWAKYAGADLRLINGWPYALMPAAVKRQPAYCNVLIAAHISAGARVCMHQEIERVADRLAYTDTDSLWIQGEMPEGDGLGEFRQVAGPVAMLVVAPKEYAIYSGEALIEAHAKGIPSELQEYYLLYGQAGFKSPVGIKEAALHGKPLATWVQRLRSRQYQWPKRAPLLELGREAGHWKTRPWDFQEIQSLIAQEEATPLEARPPPG